MNCPVCTTALVMTERQGVEIDHCPKCRGVWLDRGELDKVIERSNAYLARPRGDHPLGDDDDRDDRDRSDPRHMGQAPPYQQRKRKSFWEEMFD